MLRLLPVLALAAIIPFSCGDKETPKDDGTTDPGIKAGENSTEKKDDTGAKAMGDASNVVADAMLMDVTCGCKLGGT